MARVPKYSVIQGSKPAAPAEIGKEEFYRFNCKMPLDCRDYVQEMAWKNRMSITDFIVKVIHEDMERHPDWNATLDELNGK